MRYVPILLANKNMNHSKRFYQEVFDKEIIMVMRQYIALIYYSKN